ncbi:hypothetical protein KUTeg_020626 [Tegillarca granosa]|uniref:Uncharacterized protein n=1 Tax=Tegillarca granosa TaxID=220873 RepID=A0ABQ9E8G7_TEGGR|nr:hypothetical protein KUTeg_020626 [Tegillarca granosa]
MYIIFSIYHYFLSGHPVNKNIISFIYSLHPVREYIISSVYLLPEMKYIYNNELNSLKGSDKISKPVRTFQNFYYSLDLPVKKFNLIFVLLLFFYYKHFDNDINLNLDFKICLCIYSVITTKDGG